MIRDYLVTYKNNDRVYSSHQSLPGPTDQSEEACSIVRSFYEDDDSFSILGVTRLSSDDIDFQLVHNMHAVKRVCELGRKLRATTNIKFKQPLSVAYVYFNDYSVRSSMVFGNSNEMEDLIREELNIGRVVFIDDLNDNLLFDVIMKPNFRVLGPKGFGKQAQTLKARLAALSADDSNRCYQSLRAQASINDFGFPISLEDLEVSLVAKNGLKSVSNHEATVTLDITLNPFLLKKGRALEIRSSVQDMRKRMELDLQEKISVKIYSDVPEVIAGVNDFKSYIKYECQVEDLSCSNDSSFVLDDRNHCYAYDDYTIQIVR